MNFDTTIEVAEWLGKSSDVVKLQRMKQISEEGKFYVTVWGHYSAGKSRLINNILGKEVLPVQSRETTAVLTYLNYGTHEECVIVYEDGTCVSHGIEKVKEIFQNGKEEECVSAIDHMEVYVNNDILKQGLTLIDTPGVNTLIQKHQNLAADAIEQSGRILYVLGNSPSNVDKNFIRQITNCGVDITFVRTKCDKFIETEEDITASLAEEKEIIQEFVGTDITFLPVSNEMDHPMYHNIAQVRDALRSITYNMSLEMEAATKKRLLVYNLQYEKDLSEEKVRIEQTIRGNVDQITEDMNACDLELNNLQQILSNSEKQIDQKVSKSNLQARRELDDLITKRIQYFVDSLKQISYSQEASEEVCKTYEMHLTKAITGMQEVLNDSFDSIIEEEQQIMEQAVHQVDAQLEPPTYAEVQQSNSRMLELYQSKLLEAKAELERIVSEKQKVSINSSGLQDSFDDSVYESALQELNQELAQIPSGMALRYSENQDIQPSAVFKKVGQAADLALLLLPGDVIVKGVKAVTNTTKVAQWLHKLGKAGQVIIKAGGAVGKNAKVIDKARDAAYSVNTIFGKRGYSTKTEKAQAQHLVDKVAQKMGDAYDNYKEQRQSGNVLDALSVAYWTEKLGSHFDSSPKMEVDVAEQENRNRMRREITQEQQRLSEERIQKKKELGLITSKETELEIRSQEQLIICQRIEFELKKQEVSVIDSSRMQALNQYKQKYKDYFEKCICQLSKLLADGYYQTASQNITMYLATQNTELCRRIEEKKSKMESLLQIQENGNSELEDQLLLCTDYAQRIEEMVSSCS